MEELGSDNAKNYRITRAFSNRTLAEATKILEQLHGGFSYIADDQTDMNEGVDLHLVGEDKNVSIRIRGAKARKHYGDCTIRSQVANNGETEVAKMKRGIHADLMFYGYTDENERVVDWVLLDLHKLVPAIKEYEARITEMDNKDGTSFYCVGWIGWRYAAAIVKMIDKDSGKVITGEEYRREKGWTPEKLDQMKKEALLPKPPNDDPFA